MPKPRGSEIDVAAFRARRGQALGVTAVVTAERPPRRDGRRGARCTAAHSACQPHERAQQRRRIAAAVDEHERLLVRARAARQSRPEARPDPFDGLGVAMRREHDRRRFRRRDGATFEHELRITSALRLMDRLERRRRAAEHDRDAALAGPPDRDVAPVIAHAFLLLERRVVLLVDDDETEPRHRREHGETRPEHEVGLPQRGGGPMTATESCGKPAVQRHRAPSRQRARDALLKLRRQIDLRHQQQRLAARIDASGRRREIDLRLAAACDAVQQKGRIAAVRVGDRVDRALLLGVKKRIVLPRNVG